MAPSGARVEFRADPVRVRVPATSANLGPGYDAFGLALGLHDDVAVRVRGGGLRVDVAGEGARTVPRDGGHLVVAAMHAAFDRMGARAPGLEVSCTNRIPHGRGLGSSAAAIVAGIVAARAAVVDGTRLLDDAAALDLATSLEGHPDNVAACLHGGFTVSWTDGEGAHAARLEPAGGLAAVAFVPATELSTKAVRRLLPANVPHADAAFNAARAALLVEALTRRPELLLPATADRLHQDYRAPAMPASAALVARLRAGGIPAVVSGAGPTVLALVATEDAAAASAHGTPEFPGRILPLERAGALTLCVTDP